ncbi:MAG: DUF1493 family protein [Bacteroidia bacterium]|nr:DUF1493 family protein [Bacteroidia bacterium]
MKNIELNEKINLFFSELLNMKIDEKTIFFKDLDLVGHDASEFMSRFSKTFEVDLTDFKFKDYFLEESNIPFQYSLQQLLNKNSLKRKEFNIEHLRKIIEEKRWIDVQN